MTPILVCLLLRLAIPVTLGQAEFIATDRCFRYGVHVRLSPAACHYLRTETFEPAHPRAAPKCGTVKRGKRCQMPATKHRRSKRWLTQR